MVVWHVEEVAEPAARNVIALLLTNAEWFDECCTANGSDVRGRTWKLGLKQGIVVTSGTIITTCKELKANYRFNLKHIHTKVNPRTPAFMNSVLTRFM